MISHSNLTITNKEHFGETEQERYQTTYFTKEGFFKIYWQEQINIFSLSPWLHTMILN